MWTLSPGRLLLPVALLAALCHAASAQTATDARAALSRLPDSQLVLYVNARRIVNEMMPRVMPPAEYNKMLAETQKVGFDIRGLDYAAAGLRFVEPAPPNGLPEFVVVVRGGFNADTLISLMRVGMASQNTKRRQESYGSKTLDIIDLSDAGKIFDGMTGDQNTGQTKPSPYPEVAVTALDSNTLVAGVPAYVKATIDSASGQGGMKASTIEMAARDPNALWSLTAEIPPSLTDYLHKYGMPPNEEVDRMVGWMKQLSIAQGMNAADFTLNLALLTDQPEHASAFSGIIRMGLLAVQTQLASEAAKPGKDAANARSALNALKTLVNRTEGNTLLLSVSVPQTVVAEMVRQQTAKTAPKKRVTPRRRRRRGTTGRT